MEWLPHRIEESVKITGMYTFFRARYDSTFNFTGETHNFWECVCILGGEISVSADERIYDLKKGQIIFHKPLELHKFNVTGENGADLLVFSFSAEGILLPFFENKVFSLNAFQEEILHGLLRYAEGYAEGDAGEEMFLSAFNRSTTYSQTVALSLCRLFLSLAEKGAELGTSDEEESRIFTSAINYMKEKITEKPSIEEIALNSSVSVSSLKRIFSRFAGMGIHKYFLTLRIKKATEMLLDGASVTDVAEALNFSSQGYFTKTYKRETGVLPSEI